MHRSTSRRQFMQVTAALAGFSLVGCDAGDPDGVDAGGEDAGGGGDAGGARDAGSTADAGSAADAGGSEDAGGGTTTCSGDFIQAAISQNHGHVLRVPVAHITEGVERTYTTTSSNHCHEVTITAAQFAMLAAGETIRVYSCNSTDHEYALSCAGMVSANDPTPICGTASYGSGICE